MNWQPIETAPTDGTDFVAWNGRRAYMCRRQAYYDKWPHQDGGPTYRYDWSEISHDAIRPGMKPSHWIPLPTTDKED